MQNEKALNEMQEIQQAMTDVQDTYQTENDRWWKPENDNPDFIKHCEQLLNEQPF